jgi:hypothetical protein
MILISNIVKRVLNEILSFKELMKLSEPERKNRAKKMSVSSLPMTANTNENYWNFSYKSDDSHITPRSSTNPKVSRYRSYKTATGKPLGIRHRGRITFSKNNPDKSAIDLPCQVDCTCEDYRYNWAYANHDKDAGPMGDASLNKCNGKFPGKTNPYLAPGLCKHLLSLRNYLRTKLQESTKPTIS